MSTAAQPAVPAPAAPAATERCPRCGAELQDDQSWCLTCGTAVRTRLVPAPSWRLPVVAVLVAVVLALAALAFAFAALTSDGGPEAAPAPGQQQPLAPAPTG